LRPGRIDRPVRVVSDREDFNLENINGLDLIIDTSNMSLSDVADLVYSKYIELLQKKKANIHEH